MKFLKNLFTFLASHPKKRYSYAITGGVYLGEIFVYIKFSFKRKMFIFLSLPDMHIREVSFEKFYFGIANNIVDIVEKLPFGVYMTCKKQFKRNLNEAKRHKGVSLGKLIKHRNSALKDK